MEKTNFFWSTVGLLCFVHLFFKSQLTFLQAIRLLSNHQHIQLLHTSEVFGVGKKKQKNVWSAKLHSAEYWSPPYTFIQICTFFPLYTLSRILLKNVFSFVHHSVFYTPTTLKKRNQRETSLFTQLIYVILQNKCIKD